MGAVGEIDPGVLDAHGIGERVAYLELDLDTLLDLPHGERTFRPFSLFPSSDIDLAFEVDEEVPASAVEDAIRTAGGDLLWSVRLFDVYRGRGVAEGRRSLAYALRLQAADRTLTDADVARARQQIIERVQGTLAATLRGVAIGPSCSWGAPPGRRVILGRCGRSPASSRSVCSWSVRARPTTMAAPAAATSTSEPTGSIVDPSGSEWPVYGHDDSNTRTNTGESALDAATVGELALDWRLDDLVGVTGTPTLVDGIAYFGDWIGAIRAVDVGTGEEIWSYSIGGFVVGAPAVDGDGVYASSGRRLVRPRPRHR